MDNKFMDINQVERYVLNQLTEEELATFRGHLMFDETLRKQVVETKMLMTALATIGGAGNTSPSSKTPIAVANSNGKQMLRAAALAGTLLISGLMYYNWSVPKVSNLENKEIKENIFIEEKAPEKKIEVVPAQQEVIREEPTIERKLPKQKKTEVEPVQKIDKQRQEDKEDTRIFASNNSQPKTEKNHVDKEEVIFMSPKFFENDDDGIIAFAQKEEEVNPFIEDAIENSATKGRTGLVQIEGFENGMSLAINKNNAVEIKLKGAIETKTGSNKIYSFKLFNNNTEAFIANIPLYQEHLKSILYGVNSFDFAIDFKIELEPGLYYFTIEEDVDNEQDMIYAGKFYIYAGKFHVEKN